MLGFHLSIRLELKFGTYLNSKLNGKENKKKKRKEKLTCCRLGRNTAWSAQSATLVTFADTYGPLASFPHLTRTRWHTCVFSHCRVGPRVGRLLPNPNQRLQPIANKSRRYSLCRIGRFGLNPSFSATDFLAHSDI